MRRHPVFILLLVWLLAVPAFAARPVTLDDVLKYKSLTALEVSPDGRRAAVVVSESEFDENTMRTNIYLVDSAGAAAIKLTNGPKHDTHPRWSPDGKWIAFLSDREAKPAKAGKKQIWIISPNGGEAWQLTRGTFSVESFEWAPDSRKIALVATEGPSEEEDKRKKEKDDAVLVEHDPKLGRIYLATVPEGTSELLYAGSHVTSISFSPKGDEVAFAEQPTPKAPDSFHSVVRVIALASKQVRTLAAGGTSNDKPKWSPDGKWVAFESGSQKDWAANTYVHVVPAAGGSAQNLTREFNEEVVQFEWSDDSSSIYFTGAHAMDQHVFRATLDGKFSSVDERPGVNRAISIRNNTMAWVYENPLEPADVYFATLRPKRAVRQLRLTPAKASNFNPQVSELALGKTEVVTWKNKTDNLPMEGLLVTPPNYAPGKPYPLLLIIHGGPAGVFNRSFLLRRSAYPVQVFASQGYVVFMPNPRGSGGYGEQFRKANVKDWGYSDYNDIQDGVDSLVERGIADKDHMGVMGWSYGGYMTSWTITQTSRYRAASVGAGVTDLFSFYGTTDIPPFIESYFGGKAWEAHEVLDKHSAMNFLDKVTTPTLIQHGMEDRRVPYSQGEELYTGLRARGVPVEMMGYPRQPHAVEEPKLLRDALQRNLDWFDRYVKGNPKAASWHTAPGAGETK